MWKSGSKEVKDDKKKEKKNMIKKKNDNKKEINDKKKGVYKVATPTNAPPRQWPCPLSATPTCLFFRFTNLIPMRSTARMRLLGYDQNPL